MSVQIGDSASNGLLNVQLADLHRLQKRGSHVTVKDGIDVFDDVGANFEEVSLVLDWNHGLSGTIVHGYPQGFYQRSNGLEVSLDAEVTHH